MSFLSKLTLILGIIILLFGINKVFASKEIKKELPSVLNVVDMAQFSRFKWSLIFELKPDVYKTKNSAEIIELLKSYLKIKPSKNTRDGQIKEYKLLLKYQKNINNLLDDLTSIGNDLSNFICIENIMPMRFAKKENALAFMITDVASDNVYNTLRSTSKQRAAKIITSLILPSLKDFSNELSQTKIEYYGISITYGSKDFSNDSDVSNLKPETLTFIISAKDCEKFVTGETTEDYLVNNADIYISDRDMETGFKKIKVNLE